jgi:hypothetical protein
MNTFCLIETNYQKINKLSVMCLKVPALQVCQ